MTTMIKFSSLDAGVWGVKAFRLASIYLAISVAARLREASYVETVYGRAEDPPPLSRAIIDIALMMALINGFVWMVLCMGQLGGGLVTPEMFRYMVAETFFYTVVTVAAAAVIASIVTNKRYFNYRRDGLRAIRAFRDLLIGFIVPIGLSPFYFAN